jgi:hypothetical protein
MKTTVERELKLEKPTEASPSTTSAAGRSTRNLPLR